MSVHSFSVSQLLKTNKETLWKFISSPANLSTITPSYMGFDILTENLKPQMYPGMIIRYRVKPLLSIPLIWVTEITHVREGEYFVDEQRSGPYTLWHHQHLLEEAEGGILMTDIVHYEIPLGPLGDLMNVLMIRKKLKEIFDFRYKKMEEIFG